MIALIAFYLFATLTIASAVAVIFARNPVHSVLWLILAFFNAAGLMLIAGAEFIALLLVIVYVGAVAVLFLFVVMMLDIDFTKLRSGFSRNLPFGIIIALILLGNALEARARRQTSSALRALSSLQHATARVVRAGAEVDIPVAAVHPGELILVRPGERIRNWGITSSSEQGLVSCRSKISRTGRPA